MPTFRRGIGVESGPGGVWRRGRGRDLHSGSSGCDPSCADASPLSNADAAGDARSDADACPDAFADPAAGASARAGAHARAIAYAIADADADAELPHG
jgi:hypothetical protein